jgi:helix-turn-helix protein
MKDAIEEVTAAQAAGLTGLSERTIRRKIASGDLPARHVARNRYAIRVRDLPIRRSPDELAMRVEALEYRVRLLELQQARLAAAEAGVAAAVGEPAEGEMGSPADVYHLLAQLARETQRLAPLLTALTAQQPPRAAEGQPEANADTAREA